MARQQIGVARKFRLPKDLYLDLKAVAAHRGEPMAETVRVALAEFVERNKRGRRAA